MRQPCRLLQRRYWCRNTLALLGAGEGVNLALAWAYVVSRVIHSLHQALWNKIEVRFVLFSISTLILITLVIRAALLVWA